MSRELVVASVAGYLKRKKENGVVEREGRETRCEVLNKEEEWGRK